MKRKILGILFLLAFGVAKGPLEDAMTLSLRAKNLQLAPPDVGWKENFGQLALATLGGVRSLMASITYMLAFSAAFDDRDWGAADTLMTFTTRLEPNEPIYWDHAAWITAVNAAGAYLRDPDLRFAIRHQRYHANVERGIAYLEEGLRYNPGNPLLLQRLAELYGGSQPRKPDPRLSAKYFLEAFQNGGPAFCERSAAYEMVKLSDRESADKAYKILKRYYDRGKPYNKMERILRELPVLEDRLNIPEKDRIHPPQPFVPQIPLAPPRPSTR